MRTELYRRTVKNPLGESDFSPVQFAIVGNGVLVNANDNVVVLSDKGKHWRLGIHKLVQVGAEEDSIASLIVSEFVRASGQMRGFQNRRCGGAGDGAFSIVCVKERGAEFVLFRAESFFAEMSRDCVHFDIALRVVFQPLRQGAAVGQLSGVSVSVEREGFQFRDLESFGERLGEIHRR